MTADIAIDIAAFFALISVALLLVLLYVCDRCAALERQSDHDHACHLETLYKLDDATRELDQLRYTNGRLIAENTTLCIDLVRTEEEATRYRSHYQARKGLIADWRMTNGLCEPTRNMTVFSLEQVP